MVLVETRLVSGAILANSKGLHFEVACSCAVLYNNVGTLLLSNYC